MSAIFEPDPVEAAKYESFLTVTDTIPDAPFYVTATDTFLSGWGPAEGKDNVVVLPCRDWDEALVVHANARGRSDTKNVRILKTKPEYRDDVMLSIMDREDSDRWYQPGSWTEPGAPRTYSRFAEEGDA